MTFFDFLKDLNDTAKERLKTPISGAFVFSFVLYNWRPLVELIFSKLAIEDRIYIIDDEYCNWWAIIIPIGMAFVYTIIVPIVMIGIDWLLEPVKKNRIERIYTSKDFTTDKKITLARKQFQLKSIETGNKQIEDHLDEISALKDQIEAQRESMKQLNEANIKTINQLNSSLEIANSRESDGSIKTDLRKYADLYKTVLGDTLHLDKNIADEVLNACETLSFDEFTFLKKIDTKGQDSVLLSKNKKGTIMLEHLAKNKIINYNIGGNHIEIALTHIGAILAEIIKTT